MPQHLHLDYETFSRTELKDVGAYRYAFDPSTEILCAAMAFDNGAPVVWHPWLTDTELDLIAPYFDALENPGVLIYAHSAGFEIAISTALLWKTLGIPCPDLSRFRCTQSLARRAALPAKLETLAETLELTNLKDKRGKALINKFSKMQGAKKPSKKNPNGLPPSRIHPKDDWPAFVDFMGYCKQDVRAEQEVAWKLTYFDEPIGNANYTLHERINARGVTVNLDALRHAQKLIDEETEIVSAQFRELVGFEITQGAKFLAWLHELGCHLDNLQADTIEEFLGKWEHVEAGQDDCIDALRMKQSIAFASIKKVQTMLDCAGPHDNRIRGMLNHHGATTGRSTNSIVQFQNMKRPTIKDANEDGTSEDAYKEICEGVSLEMLRLCYGHPLEVIGSCIRHFVQDV